MGTQIDEARKMLMRAREERSLQLGDLMEAHQLGYVSDEEFLEMSEGLRKPAKGKPWRSYMRRPWREDYEGD